MNLNKPLGVTSHDCVRQVRRLLKIKRVGHAGTLDPLATGVLPIALGPATRLLQFLRQDKAYRATIRLGITTTTDDLEGEAITSPVPQLNLESVKAVLQQFQGQIQQVPPRYSAIHVQGKRLYELARSGNVPEVEARPVEIFELKVLAWRSGDFPELDLAIACGPGTYIRAIARDLGAALGTGGTLAALTRTNSSGFPLSESLTLAELESQIQNQSFCPVPAVVALNHLPEIVLPTDIAQRWCWGQRIPLDPDTLSLHPMNVLVSEVLNVEQPRTLRVHHETGRFLGIAQQAHSVNGLLLIPQVVLDQST